MVRLREFVREPEAVFWTFVFPVLLAAILGIAFRDRAPDAVRIGIARTAGAAERADALAAALEKDRTLHITVLGDNAAAMALRTGAVAIVIAPASDGSVQYRYDSSRDDARLARVVADAAVQRAAGRSDPVASRELVIRERGSRYIDFLLPGLLGLNLMQSGIWGIGFSIVMARSKKLLKRLVATPMSRAAYLWSFILARMIFLLLEVTVILGFGIFAFGVPVRGSVSLLLFLLLAGSLPFCAIGLLAAARPRTIEGANGVMNLVMLPMWIFSGIFFATSNFPAAIQPFVQALPLTALNDALRGVMLQAAGPADIAGELGILGVWLVVSFFLALRFFRWQ